MSGRGRLFELLKKKEKEPEPDPEPESELPSALLQTQASSQKEPIPSTQQPPFRVNFNLLTLVGFIIHLIYFCRALDEVVSSHHF